MVKQVFYVTSIVMNRCLCLSDKKYFPTKFYNAILQPGAKCRVAIGPFQMICYIQNINSRSADAMVDVFVVDLGQRYVCVLQTSLKIDFPFYQLSCAREIKNKQHLQTKFHGETLWLCYEKLANIQHSSMSHCLCI